MKNERKFEFYAYNPYIDNHRWTMRVFHKIRDRERQGV